MQQQGQPDLSEFQKRVMPAVFIQDVDSACRKETCDKLLTTLNQQYNKYRLAEGQLIKSNDTTLSKIPEIQKTISMIRALSAHPDSDIQFMLSDGVFVKGKPKEGLNHVSLWLGANTVVELSFEEAEKLLTENLANAKTSLSQISAELSYVKDQRTTTQVNVARVYNHSLVLKREAETSKGQ